MDASPKPERTASGITNRCGKKAKLWALEAMKMEVEVVADVAGTVKAINVKKGDAVTTGQALAVIG